MFGFLEEFFLMVCSDGALKASYLQLKAASNEKQSVDTVDTGVQAASNEKWSVDTVDTGVQADYIAVAPG